MRAVLFGLLFCFTVISSTFASTRAELHHKKTLPQTPTQEVSPSTWAGFYTGVMLGGQFGRSTDKTGSLGYNADNNEWNYNASGLNAGVELGYNYPWRRMIVGPEIELGYIDMNGSGAQPASPASDTLGKSSSDFYTSFRARIGADFNHYLVFVTGGAIGVNYTKQVIDSCSIAPCGGSTVNAKKNDFVWGYTLGGGVERFLEKKWSLKLECLYFDLSNQSFYGTTPLGNTYKWTGQTSGYIVRGGVNYYF